MVADDLWVVVVLLSHATSVGEQTTQWQPVSWLCYGLTDKAWCGVEGPAHPSNALKTGEKGGEKGKRFIRGDCREGSGWWEVVDRWCNIVSLLKGQSYSRVMEEVKSEKLRLDKKR